MDGMAQPIETMTSRMKAVRWQADKLRVDARILIAKADAIEAVANELENDLYNLSKAMPQPAATPPHPKDER